MGFFCVCFVVVFFRYYSDMKNFHILIFYYAFQLRRENDLSATHQVKPVKLGEREVEVK